MPRSSRKARIWLITLVRWQNQPFTYPVKPLKIELLNRLDGNKLHGRTLHSFGNRFRVAEVVLLAFRIRPHIPGWHQPGVVAKRTQLSAQVMRPDARLHADQARGSLRPLSRQFNCSFMTTSAVRRA